MDIEESKIIDLIASYEKCREDLIADGTIIDLSRAWVYKMVIDDLQKLLPLKRLADLDVPHFDDLSGTMIEYAGMKGVILGGSVDVVTLFTFADTRVVYADPSVVCLLDEDRVWDEKGEIRR